MPKAGAAAAKSEVKRTRLRRISANKSVKIDVKAVRIARLHKPLNARTNKPSNNNNVRNSDGRNSHSRTRNVSSAGNNRDKISSDNHKNNSVAWINNARINSAKCKTDSAGNSKGRTNNSVSRKIGSEIGTTSNA